jgi:hypothetical protein
MLAVPLLVFARPLQNRPREQTKEQKFPFFLCCRYIFNFSSHTVIRNKNERKMKTSIVWVYIKTREDIVKFVVAICCIMFYDFERTFPSCAMCDDDGKCNNPVLSHSV